MRGDRELHDFLALILPASEQVLEVCWTHVDPVPRAVAEIREFVRRQGPELPRETADTLLLLTSELVTNAVLHARTRIDVGIVAAEQSVVMLVHDQDLALPEQDPYVAREGGWGLALVSALAESSAMQRHPGGGKTAWFRLLRDGSAAALDGAAARVDAEGRDS